MARSYAGLLLPLLLCRTAQAHDLSLQVQLVPPATVVRAVYGAGEPLAFAKFSVYSPAASGQVHQTGFTDALGYFAFRPAGPGDWRVEVDDELGHRQAASIRIPDPFTAAAPAPAPARSSRLERALLGLSVLAALGGFWYGFRARRA
jgi:nickel transport protein